MLRYGTSRNGQSYNILNFCLYSFSYSYFYIHTAHVFDLVYVLSLCLWAA